MAHQRKKRPQEQVQRTPNPVEQNGLLGSSEVDSADVENSLSGDISHEAPSMDVRRQQASQPGVDFGGVPLFAKQGGGQREPRLRLQTKLTVGPANDQYEQEADQVAAQVVETIHNPTPESPVQRAGLGAKSQGMQDEAPVQMKSATLQRDAGQTIDQEGGAVSEGIESEIESAKGSGQSLQPSLQKSMGQAMGTDFSNVRIHTGTQADQLNQSIQAKAFTTGSDVFFRQGEYNPGSKGGQELIAHELTHVVQQGGASIQPKRNKMAPAFIQRTIRGATKAAGGMDDIDEQTVKEEVLGVADTNAAYLGTGGTGPQGDPFIANGGVDTQGGQMGGGGLSSNSQVGGGINALGGALGTVVNGVSLVKSIEETQDAITTHQQTSKQLAELKAQGAPELYAAIQILEQEKANAKKGMADGGVSLIAAVNGIGNGLSTLINGVLGAFSHGALQAATVIANTTFAIGAGINALVGTVNGIRDIRTAFLRKKKQGATKKLLDFCGQLGTQQQESLAAKKTKIDELKEAEGNLQAVLFTPKVGTLEPDIIAAKVERLKGIGTELATVGDEVVKDSDKVAMLTKMMGGLSVSARKQGQKEKLGSAALNLTGAAGGAALLAATIGGVAAAATPVGWALSGIAAVSILIYTVSKFYKRKIRSSNVIRMRQEKAAIEAALSADPPEKLRTNTWNRSDFPTQEKKSKLNKFLNEIAPWKSKGKSGKISIGDRLNQIDAYLAKYDVKAAGDAVYEGITAALTQDVGDQSVEVSEGQSKTFNEAVRELLTSLKINPDQIISSLESDNPQAKEAAEKLIKQKMKLLPTSADNGNEPEADEADDSASADNGADVVQDDAVVE